MFISKKLEVRKTIKGKSLFAREDAEKDKILIKFEGQVLHYPKKSTLQIDENKHLEREGTIDNYLNHSCKPNGYVNFDDLTFRTLRKIKKGEEVTFNYLTTEWDMAYKFQCQCNSENCLKHIKGFKYLTPKQKKKLEPLLSPFLKRKLKELRVE